jgi:hypothetical protein
MTPKRLIPLANGLTIDEQFRTEAELPVRRAAIQDAAKHLTEAITKANIKDKIGYAGIADATDTLESVHAAIDDIKMPNEQNFQHIFLYIEIDSAMKMSELAELNNAATATCPDGVESSIFYQTTLPNKGRKTLAITF